MTEREFEDLSPEEQEYWYREDDNQEIQRIKQCAKEPKGCILQNFGECERGCSYYR